VGWDLQSLNKRRLFQNEKLEEVDDRAEFKQTAHFYRDFVELPNEPSTKSGDNLNCA